MLHRQAVYARSKVRRRDIFDGPEIRALFTLGLVMIAVFSMAFMVSLTDGRVPPAAVTATFLLNGLMFAAWFAYALARRPISFATMIGYFGMLFMVLVPFAQASTGEWKWITNTFGGGTQESIVYTNIVVFVAYGTLFLIYRTGLRAGELRRYRLSLRPMVYEWRPLPTMLLFGLFLMMAALYIQSFGGFASIAFRSERLTLVEATGAGSGSAVRGILTVGSNIMRPGFAFLALAMFWLATQHARGQYSAPVAWRQYLPLSLSALAFAVIANLPTATARFYLVPVAWLLMSLLITRHRPLMLINSLYLMLGVYLSSVFDNLKGLDFDVAEAFFSFSRKYFFAGHFNSWETILLNIAWVARDGYSWGMELLSPLIVWIPRSIWESKPLSPSIVFATEFLSTTFDFGILNVGVSTLGSFYKSFGLVGAILFGLVSGYFAGYMDGRFHDERLRYKNNRDRFRFAFPSMTYYPFMAGAFFIFLRGQIWIGMQFLISVSLCYFLVSQFAIRKIELRR